MDLQLAGLASNFDWKSLIDQLIEVERTPEVRLRADQNKIELRNNAYGSIKTQLSVLKNRTDALKDAALYNSHTTKIGDATIASATATTGAATGVHSFAISQLATASIQRGSANAGAALSATSDVSGVVLGTAGFSAAISAGTFSVNGKQVTVATTDTLQQVFDKISTATSGTVTASYDPTTDKITFSSGGAIVLGSAADTSNFLQVTRLNNNGTGTVSSSAALGSVQLGSALTSANFATTVSDGGSGAGKFKINGVEISFATTDSVNDVLARINNSTAGVTAGYDVINDRFTLTNKTTGDLGIALEDVTGNFLAASGLSSGSLSRGSNLLYTIDGGGQLVSQSNTISEVSSGITGLSVTALKAGTTTVEVATDTAKIKTAITDFLTEYNKAQSIIDTNTASSRDAKGVITAGLLAGEGDAFNIASKLRSQANGQVTGLSGSLTFLSSLGFDSNGNDNNLALTDGSKLDDLLANNPNGVKDFFANTTNGWAVKFSSYLDSQAGDDGSLVTKQDALAKESTSIDTQISDMERRITATRGQLTASFVAMEQAQARINQQLQYLSRNLGLG